MNYKSDRRLESAAVAPDANPPREWRRFLLLAFVGLPVVMSGLIVIYGFLVWFSQMLIFGPPT